MTSSISPRIGPEPAGPRVYKTVLGVFFKNLCIFLTLAAALAVGGWLGTKAYKRATERRMLAQAADALNKKDPQRATLCLTRALQVNPLSLGASRMTADMLEEMGSPGALGWRIRVAQLDPADSQNRFAWAEAALRAQNLRSAANALDGVDAQARNTAAYHKLAGALTWALGNASAASSHYHEALRLEPTNALVRINLATIEISSTNVEIAGAARAWLEHLKGNPDLRVHALRRLAEHAERGHRPEDALGYSKQIVENAPVAFNDKLNHLRLLAEATNAACASWLKTLSIEATNSPAHTYAFGRWLAKAGRPADALRWLLALPAAQLTNQPVPLLLTDCLVATADWQGLLNCIVGQEWGEADYYRLALESLAQRSLGHDLSATTAWRKAARLCTHRLDRLTRLSQVASSWGWKPEQTQILRVLAAEFPKERWAVNDLVTELYTAGETRELADVLAHAHAANPDDNLVKNNLAGLLLLRGADLERAHRLAREAFLASPKDPYCISTYAYSLLLQNKPGEAVDALRSLKPDDLKIPSVAAYYGIVQARTGHRDIAQEALQRAEEARLLPEELEVLRAARALPR